MGLYFRHVSKNKWQNKPQFGCHKNKDVYSTIIDRMISSGCWWIFSPDRTHMYYKSESYQIILLLSISCFWHWYFNAWFDAMRKLECMATKKSVIIYLLRSGLHLSLLNMSIGYIRVPYTVCRLYKMEASYFFFYYQNIHVCLCINLSTFSYVNEKYM